MEVRLVIENEILAWANERHTKEERIEAFFALEAIRIIQNNGLTVTPLHGQKFAVTDNLDYMASPKYDSIVQGAVDWQAKYFTSGQKKKRRARR